MGKSFPTDANSYSNASEQHTGTTKNRFGCRVTADARTSAGSDPPARISGAQPLLTSVARLGKVANFRPLFLGPGNELSDLVEKAQLPRRVRVRQLDVSKYLKQCSVYAQVYRLIFVEQMGAKPCTARLLDFWKRYPARRKG